MRPMMFQLSGFCYNNHKLPEPRAWICCDEWRPLFFVEGVVCMFQAGRSQKHRRHHVRMPPGTLTLPNNKSQKPKRSATMRGRCRSSNAIQSKAVSGQNQHLNLNLLDDHAGTYLNGQKPRSQKASALHRQALNPKDLEPCQSALLNISPGAKKRRKAQGNTEAPARMCCV